MKKFLKHFVGILGGSAAVLGAINTFLFIKSFGRTKSTTKTTKKEKKISAREQQIKDEIKEKIKTLQEESHEQIEISSYDQLKLFGRLYAPLSTVDSNSEQTPKILLAIHGFHATGLGDFAVFAQFYRTHGFYLCLPDNRAHGNSEGKYIGFGYHDRYDCLAWCHYLVEHFGEECSIYLHGMSMGAATVMSCCDADNLPKQVKGIVEDCGYSNGWDQIGHVINHAFHLPKFPMLHMYNMVCQILGGYSLKDICPIDSVPNSKVPILFIHGDKDTLVPTDMVYKLYSACKGKKRLLIVNGANHASSYFTNRQEYEKTLLAFIESCK